MPTNNNNATYAPAGYLFQAGLGLELTAAASITLTDAVHTVSGSATITTILGGTSYNSNVAYLIKKAGATWTLGSGGNITGTLPSSIPAGSVITLVWNTTAWVVPASSSALLGSYNVKDYGALGDGITNDTTAIRACILAAAQANYLSGATSDGSGPEVVFPPGEYVISDNLPVNTLTVTNGGAYVNFRGIGHPIIRQTDATKDILFWTNAGGLTGPFFNEITGITFHGGRNQISATTGVNNGGRLTIRDCYFKSSADYAVKYSVVNFSVLIDNCHFANCAKMVQNECHAGVMTNCLVPDGAGATANTAMILNAADGSLVIRDFHGSPNVSSVDGHRWIDNNGNGLTIDSSRFGGEGATGGIGVVWQFAPPNATNGFSYPTSVSITNCDISAGHNFANAGVVNIQTNVPQTLVMRGNRHYGHAPHVVNGGALVFATYFATFPATYRWKFDIEPETKWFEENTDLAGQLATVPTDLIPYITGFAASAKLVHTGGWKPLALTDGTDATPVNTEFYVAEIEITARTLITGISVLNGSAVSGNLKIALFGPSGNVVAISASTAQSGTNVYQRIAFTGKYLATAAGTYYIGVFVDNSTARIRTHAAGDFGASKATGQVYATGFTTITPPSTFTANLGPIASLY